MRLDGITSAAFWLHLATREVWRRLHSEVVSMTKKKKGVIPLGGVDDDNGNLLAVFCLFSIRLRLFVVYKLLQSLSSTTFIDRAIW